MAKSSDSLCAHCRSISPHIGESKWGKISVSYNRTDQYPDFPALEVSAAEGCAFCGLLRHALQDKYSDAKIADAESDFHPSIRATWPRSGWDSQVTIDHAVFSTEEDWPEREMSQAPGQSLGGVHALSLRVWPYPPRRVVDNPELNNDLVMFAVYADSDYGKSLEGISRRKMPDRDTLSDTNVLLISEWLSTCSMLHTECRHKSNSHLPTRVIDVGPADSSQMPRLIVTSKETGDYVALSHCWGSLMESDAGKYARTLRTNLKDMQRGIPLDKLPQTFQDAILTVRKLKLRFLWVDALCIVQDDPADWAREAARMNDVYGSAYLTIAATSAGSSTDGFLKRPQEAVSSILCHRETGVEPVSGLLVAYMQKSGNQRSWFSNIETARWNTRGWTFQERLLSRRILHFAKRKLFWECRATDASEENEPPRDPRYRTSWLKVEDSDEPSSLIEQNAEPWESSRFDVWYSIVSRFSARELSYETDVLPALSGLAHAFGLVYQLEISDDGNDYLAGLWREDVARGLLWAPHDSNATRRCTQFVAPTWSWASIKGKVQFPSRGSRNRTFPSFVGASLQPKADDCLGAIVTARIILLARLRCLSQVVERPESSWYPLDLRIEEKTVGKGAFDVKSECDNGILWMMECMFQEPWDFRDHPTLLLLRNSGSICNTYERVGVGRLDEDCLGCFGDCEPRRVVLI